MMMVMMSEHQHQQMDPDFPDVGYPLVSCVSGLLYCAGAIFILVPREARRTQKHERKEKERGKRKKEKKEGKDLAQKTSIIFCFRPL